MQNKKLEIGQEIDIVEKTTFKVIEDTTGVMCYPTFIVWCNLTNRRKVVAFDIGKNDWTPLSTESCKLYFQKIKDKEVQERIANRAVLKKSQLSKVTDSYIRHGIHKIEEILPLLNDFNDAREKKDKEYITLDGVQVKTTSQRYMVFKESQVCYRCGLKATFFASEKMAKDPTDKYHFNLYGVDSEGHEVLFTRDHIIPVSKGGSKELSNQKTMCVVCNFAKDAELVQAT